MKSGHGCKEREVNSKVQVAESLRPTLKSKDFSAHFFAVGGGGGGGKLNNFINFRT